MSRLLGHEWADVWGPIWDRRLIEDEPPVPDPALTMQATFVERDGEFVLVFNRADIERVMSTMAARKAR